MIASRISSSVRPILLTLTISLDLLNLGSISNKINKKEIYEFYGMHHLIDRNFFEDFNMNVQNSHEHQSFNIYTRFVRKIRQNKIRLKIDIYKNFIRNKKIRRLVKI